MTFISDELAKKYGFTSSLEFISNFKALGIDIHPNLEIKFEKNSGTGLYLNIDSKEDEEEIEVLSIPRSLIVSIDTFWEYYDQVCKKQEEIFRKNKSVIDKFNKNINDDELPIISIKSLMKYVVLKNDEGISSKTNDLELVLISLKIYDNYVKIINEFLKNEELVNIFKDSKLMIFENYLKVLFKTKINVFQNTLIYKDDKNFISEDSDDFDLIYSFNKLYQNGIIGMTLEQVLENRYFHYDDYLERIKEGFNFAKFHNINMETLKQLLTIEEFQQCIAIVSSRSLELPDKLDDVTEEEEIKAFKKFNTSTSLVPIIDFANHSNDKILNNAYFDINDKTFNAVLKVDQKKLAQNNQIFISYDPIDKLIRFFLQYGFLQNLNDLSKDVWEISLCELDSKILPFEKFNEFYKWFKFLPTFQLILNFKNGEIEIEKINLSKREDIYEFNSIDDFLVLFHPNLPKLVHYNESCFDKHYSKDEAKNSGFKNGIEMGEVLNYHNRNQVVIESQDAFYLKKNKKSKLYPQSVEELKDLLNDQEESYTRKDLIEIFENFLLDKYLPSRLAELISYQNEVLPSFSLQRNDNNNFDLLINFETKVLSKLVKTINDRNSLDLYIIKPEDYEGEWQDSRSIPTIVDY